uniref:Putative NEP1-interacting protein-like 1 n=1 Tax=Davidia involucrata TaxID=16924 RepID=A0A5B6ZLD9_DAVIN
MADYETGALFTVMKKAVFAVITCSIALGGATVGIITGAIKGQTTETGFLRGAGIGAVAGAITAVQLMELMVHGESFSKVALFCSLVNGKVFMEWVTPAVLKAYQWQISTPETSFMEISDIYENTGTRGLSQDSMKKLPTQIFHSSEAMGPCHESSCTICLEDFKNGVFIRILPSCRHTFHLHCIDEWLTRHGSCPICREDV